MRVLHLPFNIASYPSHTVRGLRQIGIDAFGLVFGSNPVQSAEELKVIEIGSRHKVFQWILGNFKKLYYYYKWVDWADVIHWYFGVPLLPFDIDLKYIKLLNKPAIIEWLGSDIRIPEVELADNPYYKAAFQNGYEYSYESLRRSLDLQKRFTRAGFASMAQVCMLRYIQKDICSKVYVVPQRIILSDYIASYPNPDKNKPLIVHSANGPVAKGTQAVLKAIEKLKLKYNFEFRIIQKMPRNTALKLVKTADIFLDQFVIGDHGMAALEAMAFGKPVLCYIKPSMVNQYPSDLPIINANQDNLAEILESLLKDGNFRYEIGKKSRVYVEKYHDANKIAHQLVDIYNELIAKKGVKCLSILKNLQ